MFFYYFVFFLMLGSVVAPISNKNQSNFLFFIIAVGLIIIAGFRTIGNDNDSPTYVEIFNTVGMPLTYFKDYQYNSFLEPTYYLIPSIVMVLLKFKVIWVFLIYAILGVATKFLAISKLTDFTFLSILVYFSHFFLLHELTQIRVGVSSGILLLCVIEIQKRNFLRFLLLIGVGLLFHYSFIVFLPFYFLDSRSINKKAYLVTLFLPYILIALNINVITILQTFRLGVFSEKIEVYTDLLSKGVNDTIKTYSVVFLVQLLLCTIFILKSDLLIQNNKYSLLLLKIYCIAASSLVMFSNMPVLGIRFSELLNIVEIILIPFLLYVLKPKYTALVLVIAYSLVNISINLLYAPILKPYFGNP